jgi:hypothetical protein
MKKLVYLMVLILSLTIALLAEENKWEVVWMKKTVSMVDPDTGVNVMRDTTYSDSSVFIPSYRVYNFKSTLTRLSDADSTGALVTMWTKTTPYDSTWDSLYTFSMQALNQEVFRHFVILLEADTAIAKGGHIGNYFKFNFVTIDTTGIGAYLDENLFGAQVELLGRK